MNDDYFSEIEFDFNKKNFNKKNNENEVEKFSELLLERFSTGSALIIKCRPLTQEQCVYRAEFEYQYLPGFELVAVR